MPPRTSNRRPVPLAHNQNQQLNADGSAGDFSEQPLAARKLTIRGASDGTGQQSRGLEYFVAGDPDVRFYIDTQLGDMNVALSSRAATATDTLLDTAVVLGPKYWDGSSSEGVRIILRGENTAVTPTSQFSIAFIDDDETQAFNATVLTLTHAGVLTTTGALTAPGVTLDGYAISAVVTKVKTAAQTVNNSTSMVEDTHLALAVGASEIWAFKFVLYVNSVTATPDFKYDVSAPVGGRMFYGSDGRGTAAASTGQGYATARNTAIPHTSAETDHQVVVEGSYAADSNGGTITLRWAQNTATVEDTTVEQDSYAIFTRLA